MKIVYSIILLLFVSQVSNAQIQGYALNDVVNDFTVTDIHGGTHTLYDYTSAGKYVYIDFSFVACVPCQGFAPKFNEFYDKYGCNEGPPVQSFKYPLKQDLEWNYRHDYFIINKKVVGKETIELPSGNYECWKIQWLYDFTNTGQFVGNITFYEYVSTKGLIKRILFMKDVPITSPENPLGEGLMDFKEEIVLTGINF